MADSIHVRFDKTERVFPPKKRYAWINLRDGQLYEVGHLSIPECWRLMPFIRGVAFKLATAIQRCGDSVIIDAFRADRNGRAFVENWREDGKGNRTYCDHDYQGYTRAGVPQIKSEVARERIVVPFKVFKLRAWYDAANYSA